MCCIVCGGCECVVMQYEWPLRNFLLEGLAGANVTDS
jgi:hypothetical protein